MAYALQSRLSASISNALRRYLLLPRYTANIQPECRCLATRENIDVEEDSKPVKYTSSKANIVTAESARKAELLDDTPWSQTISLWLSLAAFLIYFGYLREENDLDRLLDKDIHLTVPGLKEAHEKLSTPSGRDQVRREMYRNS